MKTTTKETKVAYKDKDTDKELTSTYTFDEQETLQECIKHAEANLSEEDKGKTGEEVVIHRYNYNTERYSQQNSRNKLVTLIDTARKVAGITNMSVEEALAMIQASISKAKA